jgi:hypothetical protein
MKSNLNSFFKSTDKIGSRITKIYYTTHTHTHTQIKECCVFNFFSSYDRFMIVQAFMLSENMFLWTIKIILLLKYGTIQTRLRLNVCNKEVNNVTMNNLFVMQCQFHIVAQRSSYIVSSQSDKVWQFYKSYDKKKDR